MDLACFEPTAATGTTSTRIWTNSQTPLIASYTSLKCTKLFLSLSLTCLHITAPPFQAHLSGQNDTFKGWRWFLRCTTLTNSTNVPPSLASAVWQLLLPWAFRIFSTSSRRVMMCSDSCGVCVVFQFVSTVDKLMSEACGRKGRIMSSGCSIARQWWSTSFDTRNKVLIGVLDWHWSNLIARFATRQWNQRDKSQGICSGVYLRFSSFRARLLSRLTSCRETQSSNMVGNETTWDNYTIWWTHSTAQTCANLRLSGDSLPYCVGLKMSETCHAMLVRTVKLPGPVNDLDPDPTAEANPATGSVGLHRVTRCYEYHDHQYPQCTNSQPIWKTQALKMETLDTGVTRCHTFSSLGDFGLASFSFLEGCLSWFGKLLLTMAISSFVKSRIILDSCRNAYRNPTYEYIWSLQFTYLSKMPWNAQTQLQDLNTWAILSFSQTFTKHPWQCLCASMGQGQQVQRDFEPLPDSSRPGSNPVISSDIQWCTNVIIMLSSCYHHVV